MIEVSPEIAAIAEKIGRALSQPFDASEVKHRPGATKGNRALALPYVDARVIEDRLDEVLGPSGWQDDFEFLPDGSVICRLRIRFGSEWIQKTDVGGPSEQPDEGDRRKAAVSDALKRAAVKFGVGRYLYRLPQRWVDYDPQRKQLVMTQADRQQPAKTSAVAPKQEEEPERRSVNLPANGKELKQRLQSREDQLAARYKGRCKAGDLLKFVRDSGVHAGFPVDLEQWAGPAMFLAVDAARAFESKLKKAAGSVPVG